MFDFLSKFEFLNRIFHREESRKTARDRLRIVIVQDRASMAPQILEHIKEDLIAVFTRYMEIDVKAVEIGLERRDGTVALAANIPILRIRTPQPDKLPAIDADQKKRERIEPPHDEIADKEETTLPVAKVSRKSHSPAIRGRRERLLKKTRKTGKSRK